MSNDKAIPELVALTAAELRAGLAAGHFSRDEVSAQYLRHIDRVNPQLNALVRIDRDAWQRGHVHDDAALGGVPVSIKDNLWVDGWTTSNGSRLFRDFRAPEDALAVSRLRAAGAVLIGASNCSEFACKGNTTNPLHGATRHPLDPSRTPGGSSGGAAAAVAAGLCAVALATDAGGSVRRPAAHVGVVGFKPTRGVIAHGPGFAEPVYDNSVIGLLARSVEDVSQTFEPLLGQNARDPLSVSPAMLAPVVAGRRLRIAYSPRLGLDFAVDPGVARAVDDAARRLSEAGHRVELRDPPWPGNVDEADLMPLQLAGLALIYGDAFRRDPHLFDPDIASQIEAGLALPAVAVAAALELRKRLFTALRELFTKFDCLLTPTTPCVAWPVESNAPPAIEGKPAGARGHAVFTPLFNHTYVPACSIPCGLAEHDLPAGAQIVGPMYADRTVLQLAAELEALQGHAFRRPVVALSTNP
ncbi:amidase [Paraburkholderia susongensis]|uniref:Aspartyl-tRNA(Asn)/glutamyl-tRNA(Gln) amidotransferase subunit A n=1 Tax=Paraburkholderia susongensis TaxID=1515439 RepID=A0A1X7IS77_9BURK|nr:amidase [Paraburkholderia susongensis]SMG17943.1 aspartyl-tRNA(Asn)/glutamyl-tRNA(Gln) amidotransferase subunit A [Paraburkholderia susongensis]